MNPKEKLEDRIRKIRGAWIGEVGETVTKQVVSLITQIMRDCIGKDWTLCDSFLDKKEAIKSYYRIRGYNQAKAEIRKRIKSLI